MPRQPVDYEEALEIVRQLAPGDQSRLVEEIMQGLPSQGPLESLYGLLRRQGPSPSEEDIKEVRREMWANFGEKDI